MRTVRVVIADDGTGARASAVEMAERCGFEIVGEGVEWSDISSVVLSKAADLILIAGGPDYAEGVKTLGASVASLALSPDAQSAKQYALSGVGAIVSLDCDPDLLTATTHVALESARRLAEARADADKLRDSLETRKVVERAKGVLMQRLRINEDVAYRRMQRASQEENRKMREIAESILSAERLYSEPPAEPL